METEVYTARPPLFNMVKRKTSKEEAPFKYREH